jgi:voltage-gated potassium channel
MTRRSPLLNALLAILALTVLGTGGYMWIVGMGPLDALYMTVITLSTVGYREVRDLGPAGQIFTIALILSGLGIVFYSLTVIARDILEGELQRTYGRRKVERQIEHLSDHYLVCGFGRMGFVVCKELATKPVPFVVIERDPEMIARAEQEQYLCIQGDATEDQFLLRAGIKRARGLVAALSSDSDNVYVVLTARELNQNIAIVARAEDERSEGRLMHAGATRVVMPYVIGGHRMANALLRPGVLDVFDLATHSRSVELRIEEVLVPPTTLGGGVPLKDSGLREKFGVIVIAIKKPSGDMVFEPTSTERIEPGDRLIVMGESSQLRELENQFQVS